MCIIAGLVEHVASTKIIVSYLGGNKQLIVYSNTVVLANDANPVAMLLPFPNGAAGVKVIETNPNDSKCFEELLACCMLETAAYGSTLTMNKSDRSSSEPKLAVHRSGSYRYSIASNTTDLHRIDRDIFTNIPTDLQHLLNEYSGSGFGFIVCVIDSSANYSPFAYICDTTADRHLFVPTKHYHQHSIGMTPGFDPMSSMNSQIMPPPLLSNSTDKADWDHDIFVIGLPASDLYCRELSRYNRARVAHTPFVPIKNAPGWGFRIRQSAYSFEKYINAATDKQYLGWFKIRSEIQNYPNIDMYLAIPATA